jgi:signal transduction histidine kinase
LHPAKLNQLGLAAALRGFCREIGQAHGISIQFEAREVRRNLPPDVALCLYRIAQESLQNVVKHSGAGIVSVSLGYSDGELRLSVSDNGCGFDTSASKNHESLGLVSMDERIRVIKGTVTIDSVPGAGTKVEARAPLRNR